MNSMTLVASPRPRADHSFGRRLSVSLIMFLLTAMMMASAATAQTSLSSDLDDECKEAGYNMQCNQFGTIKMENQADIRGEAVPVTATLVVDQTYEQAGARWVLISIRHVPEGSGGSPISLSLTSVKSPFGNVYITSIDQEMPNEINVWVHVVDIPLGSPIEVKYMIGSSDRGAFRVETLAMPFDRGYEPITDARGNDLILYSFALVGVNKESGVVASTSGGSGGRGIPTVGLPILGVGLLGAALLIRRRAL